MMDCTTQAATQAAADSSSLRETLARIFLVFGGNSVGMALGLVASLWAMRVLGPEQYGIAAVALVILFLCWQFTGKGLDQSAVRLAAITDHSRGPAAVFETVYALKLLGNGILLVCGLFLAGWLTRLLLPPGTSSVPIYLAFVAAAGASLWGFHSAAIQAESWFGRFSLVQIASNTLKVLALAVIIMASRLTPTTVLVAAALGFFGAATIGAFLAPGYARRPRWTSETVPVVLRYSRWLVMSSVLYLLYSRIDLLLISRMIGGDTVGVYAAAVMIAQLADLMTGSILTVFLPRFSQHTERDSLRDQVRRSLRCSLLIALPLAPCYLLIEPVMNLLLLVVGQGYAGAIPLLKIMYFGMLFTMVTHPLHILFFARGRPKLVTALDAVVFVFNVVGHCYAIPRFGTQGAAVVVLLSRFLAGSLLTVGIVCELRGVRSQTGE